MTSVIAIIQKNIAVVDENDTKALARRLDVELSELPAKLHEKFGSTTFYCNQDEQRRFLQMY